MQIKSLCVHSVSLLQRPCRQEAASVYLYHYLTTRMPVCR
ncbi:hypothetical protein KNP414_02227 [Paenibacillus mucilaginosus KNP414]|uniref:Uncharacterized protein n=1 Tax=Paenibacillus mucilaginosus (strain KNP414) TaxID=1036673 RepID=F8F558_PAEMK|nr:hypothetical protein KNP414_02227 [Paenibacillus mucilaginosus KNP414]